MRDSTEMSADKEMVFAILLMPVMSVLFFFLK